MWPCAKPASNYGEVDLNQDASLSLWISQRIKFSLLRLFRKGKQSSWIHRMDAQGVATQGSGIRASGVDQTIILDFRAHQHIRINLGD